MCFRLLYFAFLWYPRIESVFFVHEMTRNDTNVFLHVSHGFTRIFLSTKWHECFFPRISRICTYLFVHEMARNDTNVFFHVSHGFARIFLSTKCYEMTRMFFFMYLEDLHVSFEVYSFSKFDFTYFFEL